LIIAHRSSMGVVSWCLYGNRLRDCSGCCQTCLHHQV